MRVLIYGRQGCSFCQRAKDLCEQKGIPYDYQIVGEDITKESLVEMVGSDVRTIPQIFNVSGGLTSYVGGYKDLQNMLS